MGLHAMNKPARKKAFRPGSFFQPRIGVQIRSVRPASPAPSRSCHILRVVPVRNQQRILRIHDHQVLHAHQRDKLLRAEDVVVRRVDSKVPPASVTLPSASPRKRVSSCTLERGPAPEVVPTEFGGYAIEMRQMLALGRAGLQQA